MISSFFKPLKNILYNLNYFSLLLIGTFSTIPVSAESNTKIIDGFNTGIAEKGFYIELFNDLSTNKQFGVGINYLDTETLGIETGLYGDDYIRIHGLSLNYRRFFRNHRSASSFYYHLAADFTSYTFKTNIDLTKETYSSGGLNFTCSACGNLKIQNQEDNLSFIPSVMVGYLHQFNDSIGLHFALGAQYVKQPNIQWETDTASSPPSYVTDQINEWVDDAQDYIDSLSSILPTVKVGISYYF